jgi:hypothetical protein
MMPKDFANYRPAIAVFDPKKISGPRAYHEASDTYFSADGKPLTPAGSDESAIGRWELTTGEPKKRTEFTSMRWPIRSGADRGIPSTGKCR